MLRFGRVLLRGSLAALVATIFVFPALVHADNVVEGFYATTKLEPGKVVKLTNKSSASVQLAPANSSSQIFGVVVDATNAPITLERKDQQVFVATGGIYPVFVTNEGGSISKGDYISISQHDGIAAKATGNQPVILGHADSSFDGVNNVTDHLGKFAVGKVNVTIAVAPNPLFKNTLAIPQPLQRIGNSIGGREVPPLRVYTALLLFLVSVSLAIILLVVGIASSLTSIGRNPLSRHIIMRGMFQVVAVSLTIFAISVAGVYLLLKI